MTQEEFQQGWLLLLAQPWGRCCAVTGSEKETLLEETKRRFYWGEFRDVEPEYWIQACTHFARGTRWPSAMELHYFLLTLKRSK